VESIAGNSTSKEVLYLLTISLNPGAPLGGSVTEYFIGSFDGYTFSPIDNATRLSNFAKDNYAGQFFYGTGPGTAYPRPVSIAWASNWQYTNQVPTASEGWRSAMTIPKANYITTTTRLGTTLAQAPYDISPILDRSVGRSDNLVNSTALTSIDISPNTVASNAVYFKVDITIPSNDTSKFPSDSWINVTLSNSNSESLKIGYQLSGQNAYAIFVDRGRLDGFENPFFTDKFSLTQAGPTYRLEGIWDRSLLEVWLDGGVWEATSVAFPSKALDKLSVSVGGGVPAGQGVKVSGEVWALKQTWA